MSNSNSTRFYVYLHCKPNGEIFYVGKGSGKRAWSKNKRGQHWLNIVNKHGLNVVIHTNGLTEKEAFDLEVLLIKEYRKIYKLANIADGGGGVSGSHANLGVPKSEAHKEKLRQAHLGKKHSYETIEKQRAALRKKVSEGWINPGMRKENIRIGSRNNNFAGIYVTPNGNFESLRQAAESNGCSQKAIRVRCKGNTCLSKGKVYTYKPKDGWSFIPR